MVHYLIGALALLLLSATPAVTQETAPCNERGKVLARLADVYQEARVAGGVTSGGLVEVFASEGGESWTIIISGPNGVTCAVSAGSWWRDFKVEPAGPDT